MFGPLPLRHKVLLAAVVIIVGVVLGTWLGAIPAVPFRMLAGALCGTALGAAVAYVLLHQSRHDGWRTHDPRLH